MLGAAVAILLWLLPLQVNGLLTAEAKCLSGYDWTFSSIRQSPCDVAVELAAVCIPQFNLPPLPPGQVYVGPPKGPAILINCLCSSVVYSLQSACSLCQGRNYMIWSLYKTNCTTVQLAVYNQDIPVGVKVPAYAYQDVSVSDNFNRILAQTMDGIESTRLPQLSPSTSPTLRPFSASPVQSSSGKSGTTNNTPAIVGGVVGGVVAIGLIASLIIFLMLRSKQKTQKYNSSFQLTNPSIIHTASPPPGTPGRIYNPYNDDRSLDPNINDPNRPLSQNVASDITGSSAQNHTHQAMTSIRTSNYSGMAA